MANNIAERWSITNFDYGGQYVDLCKGEKKRLPKGEEDNRCIEKWKSPTEYWIRQFVTTETERREREKEWPSVLIDI